MKRPSGYATTISTCTQACLEAGLKRPAVCIGQLDLDAIKMTGSVAYAVDPRGEDVMHLGIIEQAVSSWSMVSKRRTAVVRIRHDSLAWRWIMQLVACSPARSMCSWAGPQDGERRDIMG